MLAIFDKEKSSAIGRIFNQYGLVKQEFLNVHTKLGVTRGLIVRIQRVPMMP